MNTLTFCPACKSQRLKRFLDSSDHFLTQETFSIDICQDCGLKFTNPRPHDTDLGNYYKSEDYISHSNIKRGLVPTLYQWVRSFTLKNKEKLLASYVSRGTLLDYGCGSGHFLAHCQAKGWEVFGIEPDDGARAIAQKAVQSIYKTREELIEKQLSPEYSAISLWHVLEHLPDLTKVIEFLNKSLRHDGALFVAVPNPQSYDADKYKAHWAAYDLPRHLYHFDRNSIRKLFEKSGFVLVDVRPMYFDSFYVSLLSEKYKHNKARLIPAILSGAISNLKSRSNGEYSSLIYVFKKAS